MPRAVILRHLTPDGRHHYDWLLAPRDGHSGPDDRALLSFRVDDRVDEVISGDWFEAEKMAYHRWRYLDYEGEISQGRGSVERVAEGIWLPRSIEDALIGGEIEWSGRAPVSFEGWLIGGDRWRFQINAPHGR